LKYSMGSDDMREDNTTKIYLSGNHIMIRAGYSDPQLHAHKAAHLIVSLGGSITLRTKSEEHKARGVMIPSGYPHTVQNEGNTLLVFMFDDTTRMSEQIKEVTYLEDSVAERVADLYKETFENQSSEASISTYDEFFENAMLMVGLGKVESKITDERVLSAIRYVDEHITEEFTEEDVADSCYLSVSRFSHLFREQAGISFAGYVILRRMYKAYMLLATGKSITESSMLAGFSTPSHFAALNQKIFGINAGSISGNLEIICKPDI